MRRALLAAVVAVTALGAAGASAGTLTNPDSEPVPSSPAPAKSQTPKHVEACSAYGAGFVQLPGSDACIKIGGGVTTETTVIGR
ncbi:MAG: porin [Xanthobacteraceae bacterium]